jgi:hypothetical protein
LTASRLPRTTRKGERSPQDNWYQTDRRSRGQADRTKPNRVEQETRRQTRDATARDERLKRFDERVDRINPMSVVELDPGGAHMARQTGSGRMGVHEILRDGLQAKRSSDASSSTTTQGAFGAGKRDGPPDPAQVEHGRDTAKTRERVTKSARSSWSKYYKIRKSNATNEKDGSHMKCVRSARTTQWRTSPPLPPQEVWLHRHSRAARQRFQRHHAHRKTLGGSGVAIETRCRCPLPYHVLFLVFLMAVLFAANQQKESVRRAKLEEILRARDQVHGDPALRDKGHGTN